MRRFIHFVNSIGARPSISEGAPSYFAVDKDRSHESTVTLLKIDTTKPKRLDRWLDKVVAFSGSNFVLFLTIIVLLAWAFLGIEFASNTGWQVGISDAQAIINMVFDSFLVRQQLNAHTQAMVVACHLDSRATSHKRMLQNLARMEKPAQSQSRIAVPAVEFPQEDLLGRICNAVSASMGHVLTVIGYWICIGVWLAFGHHLGWSDSWFFFINSATSALMIFMLAVLANNRERHEKYLQECTNLVMAADTSLERLLREVTGDTLENEVATISAPEVGKVQRAINFYADLVGTLLGICLLTVVLVAWIVIGPIMSFDANWWLLIGTYAGLIGMNDGFVLRNLCNICNRQEDTQYDRRILEDKGLAAIIGGDSGDEETAQTTRLDVRFSIAMGNFCSHEYTVVAGVVVIIALILTASLMHWSELGQIICNVPPSIIESFFTLILITGHNIGDEQRRANLQIIYRSRLELISRVESWRA